MGEASKLLPDRIGDFAAVTPAVPLLERLTQDFNETSAAMRAYRSATGDRLGIVLITTTSDSSAYALLTDARRSLEVSSGSTSAFGRDVGTADYLFSDKVLFFKGSVYGVVSAEGRQNQDSRPLLDLAQSLAETLDKGDGDIPVLVKHLPDWQTAQREAVYAVNVGTLRDDIQNQPVLDSLSFEGGTEAVAASYDQSQLLIVEFATPQLAAENDQRITEKIQQLRALAEPLPTAYRRVGNYSVLVFNAPDEKTANQLIDQVKYEQVVQWLGEDPHWFERIQKLYAQSSAAVLIAVLETSGLSALLCLAIGGIIGALLFQRRRAQAAAAYSDAGGMARLNLDEMTTADSGNLLEGDH